MKKRDLINRMIVETRNGERFLVVDKLLLNVDGFGFMPLSRYTDDLIHMFKSDNCDFDKIYREYDIMKVYPCVTGWNYLREDDVLWERDETPVEMTFDEIKEKLGIYNLKIIPTK